MPVANTLESVRDLLLLPRDLPAPEVLEIARTRQVQWEVASKEGKNPPVRAGAAKRLRELVPLLPVLEIEAELGLLELEEPATNTKAGSRKHELRLRIEKLATRIAALPKGDERTILEARQAELVQTRVAVAPPGPDPKEVAAIDAALDALTAAAPSAGSEQIGALQTSHTELGVRIAKLPAGTEANALTAKLALAAAALAAQKVRLEIESEMAALETTAATDRRAPEFAARLEAMQTRLDALPPAGARTDFEARLKKIGDALAAPPPAEPSAEIVDQPAPPPVAPVAVSSEGGTKTVVIEEPILVDTGEMLRLRPIEQKSASHYRLPPIHFVARSRFVLGRFPTNPEATVTADFSCPVHLKRIGREHVVLQRMGREITAQDAGTPEHPTNGAWLGEQRLRSTPAAVNFDRPRELLLGFGPIFSVLVHHVPTEAPNGPPFSEVQRRAIFRSASRPSLLTGCVRFSPGMSAELPATAAWIFTDATIGSAAGAAVTVEGMAPIAARIHYWENSFWLEGVATDQSVRVVPRDDGRSDGPAPPGERVLAAGEVAPLNSGDIVRLGTRAFGVVVET